MATSKSPTTYPEINDIRHDLDSLKTNVVELTKRITAQGTVQAEHLKDAAYTRLTHLGEESLTQFKHLEDQIRAKPGQSVAIAFAAGVVASLLLGRRS